MTQSSAPARRGPSLPSGGVDADPDLQAAQVTAAALADFTTGPFRGVVVDSPPGAGKSTLVVRAAVDLAAQGERVIIVAQTNEQVDDLVDRVARNAPGIPIGRLSGQDYEATARVSQHEQVAVSSAAAELIDCPVLVGTAAKWATISDGRWPWAIIDEAYQMRSDMLLRVANRFERGLFVGDPGQLDPFSLVELPRWTGLRWDPMQSAIAVLLRNNPGLPVHRLPVSWRLPPSAAPVVASAFYPFTGFEAGSRTGDRLLDFTTTAFRGRGHGRELFDDTLEVARRHGWALHELPAGHTVRTDAAAIRACADLAVRLRERGTFAVADRSAGGAPVSIAIGTAHRDQAAAIRSQLPANVGVTVDTANRLQGREYDVTIVLHPLSGRRDATAFHLESGRLCVLTSRHRHACIIVARAGIPELLDAHPSAEPAHLNIPVKFPDGWEAHHAILAHLAQHRVRAA